MPVISATEFPLLPAVRVIVNWADVPAATHVTVFRVDCETGGRAQLRPYVAFNGDGYLRSSCGMAIFWDTEVPLDRCVRYCTQAQNALGVAMTTSTSPLSMDTFTRVLVDSWGSTETGTTAPQLYVNSGGTVPGNYDVNGSKGTHTNDSVNVFRVSTIDVGTPNSGVWATVGIPVMPTGASISAQVDMRRTDTNNQYRAILNITTAGAPALILNRTVGGVGSNLVSGTPPGTHVAGDQWTIRAETWGNLIRAKAWRTVDTEPVDWLVSVMDNNLLSGNLVGLQDRLEAGNTNGTVIITWDNFLVYDPCAGLVTIETCTQDTMLSSSGFNMLRDPVRPCNDLHVGLCFTHDPNCVPGRGVFFARLDAEGYAANSQDLQAFNSPRPATASRERSDAASTLTLITRSFADRDAMLEILRAGTPLLWQSPPEYGIPDRYIQVRDDTIARYQEDHRYQPRVITLPFVTEDRPEGPTQGICGARVKDLCDIYTSWDAMETAGLTFLDLLEGNASPSGPVDANRRRWIDVETGFANWLAVETAPNTWKSLRDGE